MTGKSDIDFNKFRLRDLVDRMIDIGEVEVHDKPVPLAHLSGFIEGTPKASLFRQAGPEKLEVIGNATGSRRRMAAAYGVPVEDVVEEYQRRSDTPQGSIEIPSDEAPVHDVVLQGDDIDLTKLHFHPQHEYDGGVYISAGIDYTIDPETGKSNVGCRRLMLRDPKTLSFNATAKSDLRGIYRGCVERGERLPVSFTVGAHPLDFMAAASRAPGDEVELVGTMRGEPVPLVKCLTNDIRVPADAEMILEGYFDEHGYREPEGPFGEGYGYYGAMHMDPLFHVTAITRRRDVLHQSIQHGTSHAIEETDSSGLSSIRTEAQVMKLLKSVIKEPVAVFAQMRARQTLRIAIRQHEEGDARKAIEAIFEKMPGAKHVYIVDDDIDVRSSAEVEWAMSGRFQADKDLIVLSDLPGFFMDPSSDENSRSAKAGFDLTTPFGQRDAVVTRRPKAPSFDYSPRYQTVRQALDSGPMYFTHLMAAVGSEDGRDVTMALDELRHEGILLRLEDGEYALYTGDDAEVIRKPGDDINITGLATPDFGRD